MARRAPDDLKEVIRDFRRDQIIKTSRRLFGERGTTEVSMDEIAAQSGVARSTVYVYFANRDELLRACVQSMYDQLKDAIVVTMEDDASPTERLHHLIRELLERIDESPAFFRLAMATQATSGAAGSAAVEGALTVIGFNMMGLLEDVVTSGIASGEFHLHMEPSRAVVLIGQQIYGALSVRAGEPEPVPINQATDEICDFVLHGLGG